MTILKEPVRDLTWVPADKVLMPIEVISACSRRRDRIDKPAMCAEAGIPYFMWVEVSSWSAHVELLDLRGNRYHTIALGVVDQQFETENPFPIAFDPAILLET